MSSISYLIIEDEVKSRQTLLIKIDLCELAELTCVGIASNSEEARWLISKNRPDIILLDINLPGKNGFECLEEIQEENYSPEVIFTSAYNENEYLMKALKVGPVNYLVKPIDIDELKSAFLKAITRVNLKHNQSSTIGRKKFIGVKEVLYLKPEQIAYCRADGHYSNMFLTNGKLEVICQSIGAIEKELPPNVFFRIDRSSLVNTNLVESIDLKKQTCMLRDKEFSLNVEMSLIGLKRLMVKLEEPV